MKVLGIILELNPFHNGHKYFIEEAKRQISPDITIAVISSSFSMRGDAMVIDKWERAKIALNHGIDLVLELPFLACVNSSDYFCYNAVKTLVSFNITDLAFGAELNSLEKLKHIKDLIKTNVYNISIKEYLDKGFSYATSSFKAIKQLTNDKEIIDNVTLPNNTLAIGYLHCLDKLNSEVNVTVIKRINNNYYDEAINSTLINSATSLRNLIGQNQNIDIYTPGINYGYFDPNISNNNLLKLLRYFYAVTDISEMSQLFGINEGIEKRIFNCLDKVNTYDELISLAQTKRYPANRIKRTVLYLLLHISKEYENKYHSYLRILAMNATGRAYLNTLDKETKAMIITSFKNQNQYLVDIELKASKLYGIINNQPNIYLHEYQVPFIGEDQ